MLETISVKKKQIRGWRAGSAVERQGKGLRKNSVYSTDTGMILRAYGLDSIGILFQRAESLQKHGQLPRKFDPKDLSL